MSDEINSKPRWLEPGFDLTQMTDEERAELGQMLRDRGWTPEALREAGYRAGQQLASGITSNGSAVRRAAIEAGLVDTV